MAQNTLLICFDFPPNEGIGGRRWAKLAKGLAKLNTVVHVIKADPKKKNSTSPWTAEVEDENIHIHSLPRTYPEVVSDPGNGLLDKINYRIQRYLLKQKTKGTIYDVAIEWDKLLIPKALEVIDRENIANLIVTGAPFNLFPYAAEIKAQRPELKLLLDYRDPWLLAVNYGIPGLTYPRFLEEKFKQHKALAAADFITCPNEFMLEEIKSSDDFRKIKGEYKVIPHFYDQDDINQYLVQSKPSPEKIKLVYGGTLYMGLEPWFKKLCEALDQVKASRPELYNRLQIDLFSKDLQFATWFENHQEVIHLQTPIGKELFTKITEANACFIFLAHHNKDYRTTKFFEILPFGKPLVYLGEKGFVSEFIEEKELGWVLHQPEIDFIQVLQELENDTFQASNQFDYKEFSLDKTSEMVEGWLL